MARVFSQPSHTGTAYEVTVEEYETLTDAVARLTDVYKVTLSIEEVEEAKDVSVLVSMKLDAAA